MLYRGSWADWDAGNWAGCCTGSTEPRPVHRERTRLQHRQQPRPVHRERARLVQMLRARLVHRQQDGPVHKELVMQLNQALKQAQMQEAKLRS